MVIVNKIIPPKGFLAINLFGLIFSKRELTDTEKNHEAIHTAQMRELLYIGFYILYVLEWLQKVIVYDTLKDAYRNLSFEKEAYKHQNDLEYLKTRKHFAEWRK